MTREDEARMLHEEKGWSKATIRDYFAKRDLETEIYMATSFEDLKRVVWKLVDRIHVAGMY